MKETDIDTAALRARELEAEARIKVAREMTKKETTLQRKTLAAREALRKQQLELEELEAAEAREREVLAQDAADKLVCLSLPELHGP